MYIDFIPLAFYTSLYYQILLVVNLLVFLELWRKGLHKPLIGISFLLLMLVYIGYRPISGAYFTDMATYATRFELVKMDLPVVLSFDPGFTLLLRICAKTISAHSFFFVCACLYIVPLYFASKKWFRDYWFYAFLMLAGSFSFWAYGVNGIRNGIATSLFLLAVSRDKKIFQIIWLLIAISFHKSLLLPAVGFIITFWYNKPRSFFLFWLAAIPLSLAFPTFWENFFSSFMETRGADYLSANVNADLFSHVGFRWDFLVYSAMGVFSGWYYLFRIGIKDVFYTRLFNTYLFANAFWILVIRASYSNRFAYLSWFMLAIIIIYPWLRYKSEKLKLHHFAWVLLAYYGFTYFMQFVYYG